MSMADPPGRIGFTLRSGRTRQELVSPAEVHEAPAACGGHRRHPPVPRPVSSPRPAKPKGFRLDPYRLLAIQGLLYCVGRVPVHDSLVSLAIDRLHTVTATDDPSGKSSRVKTSGSSRRTSGIASLHDGLRSIGLGRSTAARRVFKGNNEATSRPVRPTCSPGRSGAVSVVAPWAKSAAREVVIMAV